ncbi:MAG: porin family protein [Tunicatimonas sp.]|uniref:porin family protein n=1 Tax=Tunicatimonas sp. TaxID=1940096 RepID=UPI003C73B5AA
MKKLFFLFVCLGILSYHTQAQVVFNPKIGVNFSQITSESINLSEEGLKAGLNAGIDLRFGGTDNIVFFQPGLHYYNIGSNFKAGIEDEPGTDDIETEIEDIVTVHSLKIPLNIGVYLTGTDGPVHVRLSGGVVPTFILGVGDSDIEVSSDDFTSASWGLNGGLGFDFSVVSLDFNYEHGLSDVLDEVEAINATEINGRNRMFTVSLGVVL